MRIGSLITVCPARDSLYLVVGDLPEHESTWPAVEDGVPLGRLWVLYDSARSETKPMYEKFIEVVNESR